MTQFPVDLFQVGGSELGVTWSDGHQSRYVLRTLRLECPCAGCVDEWTREKRLQDDSVPIGIKPKRVETVGRYAIKISWDDGHDTGFYTFGQLRSMCGCSQCHKSH